MKTDRLYLAVKELGEKMEIRVVEKSFRNSGLPVQSGLCVIKGQRVFIMDRHLPLTRKLELLVDCLRNSGHEHIYLPPAVRELLGGTTEAASLTPQTASVSEDSP